MTKEVDRTLWVGNISDKVTDDILYELFLQAGPLEKVSLAKEKDGRFKGFAFVTFVHDVSVPYTMQLMDGVHLHGRNLRLQSRPGSVHHQAQQQQQQENLRNNSNPYQNISHMTSRQHQHNPAMQNNMSNPYQHNTAQNPYNMQPGMGHQSVTSPQFHRSHTWHGGDLAGASQQQDRDRDSRGSRNRDGRDSDRSRGYSSRDRDNSGNRYRGNRVEDYRNSPNSYTDNRHKPDQHHRRGRN